MRPQPTPVRSRSNAAVTSGTATARREALPSPGIRYRETDPAQAGATPCAVCPTDSPPSESSQAPRPIRQLRRTPALDGLRAVAVLAVMLFHFRPYGVGPGGWMGVDVFFALSGFLITATLLQERARAGRVSLARFHVRRVLRLQPALLAFLVTWLVALALFGQHSWFTTIPNFPLTHRPPASLHHGLRGAATAVIGVNNWLGVFSIPGGPVGQLWSLSIEDQFYIVWPFVLLALLRIRPNVALWGTLALACASAAACIVLWYQGAGNSAIYFGTETEGQGLLFGSAAAQLWSMGALDGLRDRLSSRVVVAVAWLLLVVLLFTPQQSSAFRGNGGLTLVDLVATIVVIGLTVGQPSRISALLSSRVMVYVGRRSYAVYLWSYLFATWLHALGNVAFVPGLIASLIAAELSYRLIESPALALKQRLGSSTSVQRSAVTSRRETRSRRRCDPQRAA